MVGSAAATARSDASERVRKLTFASVAVGNFVVTANLSTMNVAFPALEATFGDASRSTLSWVLTAYTITFAALLVPSGRLADRYGRRRMFLAGLGVFAAASAAVGLAPVLPLLLAARVTQAVGAALVVPSSLGLLLAATPEDRRTRAIAAWGAVSSLGIATGPSLGAIIVDTWGWRSSFFLSIPFALGSIAVGRNALPQLPRSAASNAAVDVAGTVVFVSGLSLVVLALVESRAWGWTSAGVVGSAAAGVVLLVAFVARSVRHPAPLLPLPLFRERSFAAANLAAFLLSMSLSAVLLVNILVLHGVWGYSIMRSGLAATPSPLIAAGLAPLAGRWAARYGFRPFAVGGALGFGLGIVAYHLLVQEQSNYLGAWLPANLLVGVGIAFALPAMNAAAVADIPPAQFALAGGVLQTARQVGTAVGVALLVAIVGSPAAAEALAAYRHGWEMIALCAALSALVSLALPERARTAR